RTGSELGERAPVSDELHGCGDDTGQRTTDERGNQGVTEPECRGQVGRRSRRVLWVWCYRGRRGRRGLFGGRFTGAVVGRCRGLVVALLGGNALIILMFVRGLLHDSSGSGESGRSLSRTLCRIKGESNDDSWNAVRARLQPAKTVPYATSRAGFQ